MVNWHFSGLWSFKVVLFETSEALQKTEETTWKKNKVDPSIFSQSNQSFLSDVKWFSIGSKIGVQSSALEKDHLCQFTFIHMHIQLIFYVIYDVVNNISINNMALGVVEFLKGGYKIQNIFCLRINIQCLSYYYIPQ